MNFTSLPLFNTKFCISFYLGLCSHLNMVFVCHYHSTFITENLYFLCLNLFILLTGPLFIFLLFCMDAILFGIAHGSICLLRIKIISF